ncbi:hypothetical protein KR038_001489 [Drosophila bunnanda]|nr:hypothetical protein KR038_001489 [Drosophila bunnanda]
MGVTGLWKLIEPCGKPVPVETLEGKILAVDISIWLHQVVKGFQDNKGSALSNAHLLGLFHRLCKLLYYRVRPVFIFDGCVPQLKRDTIARRQQQRNKLSNEADRIQALLLQSLAKEKVVQQALGKNAELLLKSPVKRPPPSKAKNDEDDLFKLPELPAAMEAPESDQDLADTSASATSDSSFDETNARHAYNSSLQAIDVKSSYFRNLPADVRHEILTDIKETRKQSSWGRLHELPARSDDFASFQMKRLLKRRAVQESLEQAEQEMGGVTLTYSELSDFFSEEGIVTPTAIEQSTRQISSDEHTRFLLVRDLKKKALASTKQEEVKLEKIEEVPPSSDQDEKPSTSTKAEFDEKGELGTEYDADLAKALALSIEETKVYDEKDYEYDADQELRLNRAQSKQLKNAAKGPARAYMIEYGGMNEEEVENIMEATQLNDTQSLEKLLEITTDHVGTANDTIEEVKLISQAMEESRQISQAIEESRQISKAIEETKGSLAEDTDSSDLEVVVEARKPLQISVDITKDIKPDNDLFADVFAQDDKELGKSESDDDDDDFIEVKESEEMQLDSADNVIEVKESEEMELESEEKTTKEILKPSEEITEIRDSQESIVGEENQDKHTPVKPKPDLDSILNDLKKETAAVKNIQLNLTEASAEPKPKVQLSSILEDLQKEINEVKNIKLEQVKLNDAPIELSSDEERVPKTSNPPSGDVIELCDSDDNKNIRISPNKTPSKNKSITDFFDVSYVVKRTPGKSPETEAVTPPGTPKVPQPFYRKRTPKSGRKRAANGGEDDSDEDVSPAKRTSKASKSLFESKTPENNKGPEMEKSPEKAVDPQDLIKDAAEALKSQKTATELQEMATNLAQERKDLEIERNRQDRMGMSISQRMSIDCQELLRLFGIPYIVAPMEAEAQCAFLNATDLTHGTITDDSDIWLFGGRTVYKNFFAQNKHVMEFRAEQIEQTFNCNRGKLIQLACLVGSDYTTGIHGIGAVTALEILASFSGQDATQTAEGVSNHSVLQTLTKFRDWWQAHKSSNLPPGSSARLSLRKKLKNIELHEGFPNGAVVEAYLTPTIDDNRDAFSWGSPDVESLREFARKSFGWTTSKTDDILNPVMKKINEKKIQCSIRNYFASKSALRVQQPQVSKRVQSAIDKMSGKIDVETPEKPKKVTRTRKTKTAPADDSAADGETRPKRGKRKAATATETESVDSEHPSTSQSAPKPEKCPRIPNTQEVIPQRERDLEEMRLKKAKAAEILKNSAKPKKK